MNGALNSSPARWPVLPTPAEPMLIRPGLALAGAMNSVTVLAGTEELIARSHCASTFKKCGG
jgi:hypothetical protein